jgi:hypothetical protein
VLLCYVLCLDMISLSTIRVSSFFIMALMIKCKNPSCGFERPATIQIDEISFQTKSLSNNSENCPKCGQISTYDKPDYFFR